MLQKRKRSFARGSLLSGICLVLSACATGYREPAPAEHRGTFIEAVAPVWIASIDGQTVPQFGITGDKRFAIMPGPHVLQVQYSGIGPVEYVYRRGRYRPVRTWTQSRTNVPVAFAAEAGHTYFVHDHRMEGIWHPRISESRDPVFMDFPPR